MQYPTKIVDIYKKVHAIESTCLSEVLLLEYFYLADQLDAECTRFEGKIEVQPEARLDYLHAQAFSRPSKVAQK